MRSRPWQLAAAFLSVAACPVMAQTGLFQGPEIEQFLRGAEVVRTRPVGRGTTGLRRATLRLDSLTRDAGWKTIDESRPGLTMFERGAPELDFEDTYRAECAAYELDRLLELKMVPATVERVINNEHGSLMLWIEPNMPEADRYAKGLVPPDIEQWNRQMFRVRAFDNLIHNTDRNLTNILITPDWQIRLIDHSRAFRKQPVLRDPKSLTRFSRALVASMGKLTEPVLQQRLGTYLTVFQIRALIERRNRILELAAKLATERGDEHVYYP